jgi:hypothetical protein
MNKKPKFGQNIKMVVSMEKHIESENKNKKKRRKSSE